MINKVLRNEQLRKAAVTALRWKHQVQHRPAVRRRFDPEHSTLALPEVLKYNQQRLLGYQPFICNAPFNSLYLESRGRVYACCMSGNYVLGDIGEQRLSDIWNGEQAQVLRDDIARLDFRKACMKCAKAIAGGVYDQAMAGSYDTIPATGKAEFPRRIDFELSNTCNLACIMCNGKNSSTYRKQIDGEAERPMAYGPEFLDDLEPFLPHLKRANFLGGEPFLIDIYYDIWERILAVNPECNLFVQTNGQILNQRIRNLLDSGRFNLGISFESLDPARFERIRQFGRYDRMMKHIDWFSEYCQNKGHHLSFAITPLRQTVHELPDFVEFANRKGAEIFFNVAIEPHELVIWTLPPQEIEALLAPLRSVRLPEATNALERRNLAQFESYRTQLENWKQEAVALESEMERLGDWSEEALKENIRAQIEEMIAVEMKYNGRYADEYRTEQQQMLRSLEQISGPEDLRQLRMMAVMGADRMTSALAKMPENKRDLMRF